MALLYPSPLNLQGDPINIGVMDGTHVLLFTPMFRGPLVYPWESITSVEAV